MPKRFDLLGGLDLAVSGLGAAPVRHGGWDHGEYLPSRCGDGWREPEPPARRRRNRRHRPWRRRSDPRRVGWLDPRVFAGRRHSSSRRHLVLVALRRRFLFVGGGGRVAPGRLSDRWRRPRRLDSRLPRPFSAPRPLVLTQLSGFWHALCDDRDVVVPVSPGKLSFKFFLGRD